MSTIVHLLSMSHLGCKILPASVSLNPWEFIYVHSERMTFPALDNPTDCVGVKLRATGSHGQGLINGNTVFRVVEEPVVLHATLYVRNSP